MPVDQELSALATVASLLPTDIIYLVRDPGGGAEADNKAPVSVMDARYASASQGALADSALQAAAIGVSVQAYDADLLTDAPADGSFYGRQNAAWVVASTLPVVDETALVYKTGNVAITQIHDINAYTAARVVTWPDASLTVAGLQVSNLFTVRQDIRASGSTVAAGLYVPWISGDTLPAILAGSTNASNNRVGVHGQSNTSNGIRGDSTSGAGVFGLSSSNIGVSGSSTSGSGGQFVSGSALGISCQSATGAPVDAIQTTGAVSSVTDLFVIRKRPLTTAANGFGGALVYKLSSDTTADQFVGRVSFEWATVTHASRKARGKLTVYDTAEREAIRWEADGSAAMVGFYGSAAVAKQAVTGSRGGNAALADLLTKLATLGLITDGSSA